MNINPCPINYGVPCYPYKVNPIVNIKKELLKKKFLLCYKSKEKHLGILIDIVV